MRISLMLTTIWKQIYQRNLYVIWFDGAKVQQFIINTMQKMFTLYLWFSYLQEKMPRTGYSTSFLNII